MPAGLHVPQRTGRVATQARAAGGRTTAMANGQGLPVGGDGAWPPPHRHPGEALEQEREAQDWRGPGPRGGPGRRWGRRPRGGTQ